MNCSFENGKHFLNSIHRDALHHLGFMLPFVNNCGVLHLCSQKNWHKPPQEDLTLTTRTLPDDFNYTPVNGDVANGGSWIKRDVHLLTFWVPCFDGLIWLQSFSCLARDHYYPLGPGPLFLYPWPYPSLVIYRAPKRHLIKISIFLLLEC